MYVCVVSSSSPYFLMQGNDDNDFRTLISSLLDFFCSTWLIHATGTPLLFAWRKLTRPIIFTKKSRRAEVHPCHL